MTQGGSKKEHQVFTTEMQAGSVQATGSVEFDDMDNAIVTISVAGQILTQTELSSKELEVLGRYFFEVSK
jgi:hypothetical protein